VIYSVPFLDVKQESQTECGECIDGDGCSSICRLERTAPGDDQVNNLPGQIIDLPFQPSNNGGEIGGGVNTPVIGNNTGTPPANADTGPAAVAIMAGGAAAGYAYMKRRRK
jgi:hypothetical protein